VEGQRTVSRHIKRMPKYTPADDEMDSTYGEPSVSAPEEAPAAEPPTESVDEANAEEAEILISKDELPSGAKVGDTYTFKVSQDAGDELILEYVKADQGEVGPTKVNFEATTDRELSAIDSQGA